MTVDELRAKLGAQSDYRLAQILGVTRQLVHKWRKRGFVARKYGGRQAKGKA